MSENPNSLLADDETRPLATVGPWEQDPAEFDAWRAGTAPVDPDDDVRY